jgi:hypothetical protein
MAEVLQDYFEALERLKNDSPTHVPKGTRITNDAVALEAGRGRGSIKRSRPLFSDLIEQINLARNDRVAPEKDIESRLESAKVQKDKYRRLYEEALCREVSLLYENSELKKRLGHK